MMYKLCLAAFAALTLSACAQNVSPNTYTGADVGVVSKVKKGVVVSMRRVDIDNNSGAGGLAGGAAGAAAGSMAGNNTATGIVGAVGGAVIGGIAGNAIDKTVNHHQGFEYIIDLKDGGTISVVQAQDMQLHVKQHILIIYGAMTRLVPDETYNNNKSNHA